MTLKLGWKSILVAIAVTILAAAVITWNIHRANQRAAEFYRIDAERVVKITQLEKTLQKKIASAKVAEEAANAAMEEADATKLEADGVSVRLRRAKAALRKARAESEVKGEPELPPSEEVTFLREQNDLLETALVIRNKEADLLREALSLTQSALNDKTEQYTIMEDRYESLVKNTKQAKRRNILSGIAIGAGSFGVGFTVGVFARQ